MSPIKEFECRDARRAGKFYTVTSWPLIQDSDTAYPRIGPPGSAVTLVIALFIDEQDGPSLARLHVAAQTRESAALLRSPALNATARVGTSLCQRKVKP